LVAVEVDQVDFLVAVEELEDIGLLFLKSLLAAEHHQNHR
jgi:hypothetical protein